MAVTTVARGVKVKQSSLFLCLAGSLKLTVKDFNEDEEGMNTVEVIILLFVAAIVLLFFFTVIWPEIKDKVLEKMRALLGQTEEE